MNSTKSLRDTFYRPPFIGLLAFIVVFVVQALGHTVMILMEEIFGQQYVYLSAFLLGAVGAVMLYLGMKHPGEVAGTWLGFFAGTFLWTGWVEFSFVYYANALGEPPLMENAEIATKPEYLVMPSSIGVLLATLAYFLLNKETKCNFFHWIQRRGHLSTGKPTPRYPRNFAAITCLETIYVIWFFYVLLLVIYDQNILGDRHPLVYGLFFANTIWALYLFQRLMRFWRVTTAIRYGIPTAIIAWNSVEVLGRWHFFTEIWSHPMDYALEMSMIFGAFSIVTIAAVMTPAHQKTRLQ